MKWNYFSKTCAWIVLFVSIFVLIGWIVDSTTLKSIQSNWPTMKFTTALSFFLSGLIHICYSRLEVNRAESWSQIILLISTILILLIVVSQITAIITGVSMGLDFSMQEKNSVEISTIGRPSIGATFSFFALSVIGLCSLSQISYRKILVQYCGICIAIVGLLAVMGYIFSVPILYYEMQGTETAMALHTAILFMLLGSAFGFSRTVIISTAPILK